MTSVSRCQSNVLNVSFERAVFILKRFYTAALTFCFTNLLTVLSQFRVIAPSPWNRRFQIQTESGIFWLSKITDSLGLIISLYFENPLCKTYALDSSKTTTLISTSAFSYYYLKIDARRNEEVGGPK